MSKWIRITCKGFAAIPYTELIPFQGQLKELADEDYKKLKTEILNLGFSEPVSVWQDGGKNYLLNGHQRHSTIKRMVEQDGYTIGPIPISGVEAGCIAEAKRKVLAFTSQYGKMTPQGLYDFSIDAGIAPDEIKNRFRFPEIDLDKWDLDFFKEELPSDADEDAVPEPAPEPKVKMGEVYTLGAHRLMCGDSTQLYDVERLMNGAKADFGFCDPPYNLGFDYNSYDDNLSENEYIDFSRKWFAHLETNTMRQCVTLGTKNIGVMAGLKKIAGVACWIKKNWITSCHIAKLQQWEPLFFYGDYTKFKRVSDLFEVNRVFQTDVGDKHTCPKQIVLIEDIILNYSDKSVLDLFGGSGTTLIACEKTKRKCYMMELDPKYCGVILDRWEKYTGRKAVRADGITWSDIKNNHNNAMSIKNG